MRNVEMALPQLDYKLVKITFLIWLKIKDPEAIANKAYSTRLTLFPLTSGVEVINKF